MTMRELEKARLIVLDPLGRVLLFHVSLPTGERFWITPGGEREPNESFEDAARRELWEETGCDDLGPGPWIWERETVRAGRAEPLLLRERYYLVSVGEVDRAIGHHRRTAEEVELLDEDRWWTIPELHDTPETVFPPGLATLLEPIARGVLPATPLRI
jgi:8-oxo-dGTP pyrophosphatase MutT (NUDIX family)